jgi:hypothetical protein
MWARRARTKAADLNGWTGSLLISMIKVEPAVASTVARLASRPPQCWASHSAANAAWREVKGCFIPKADGSLRPIAIPHMIRRIWSSAAATELLPAAAKYCEPRGQLGISSDGAAAAYASVARAILGEGGTVCTDDRVNSFGEIDRSAVVHAAVDLVAHTDGDARERTRALIGALLHRVHLGPADGGSFDERVEHYYPRIGGHHHPNYGLVQGSPESSLIEAVVYAQAAAARFAPSRHSTRLMFHDDGFTAVPKRRAGTISHFERPATEAGTRFAAHTARAFGPMAGQLVHMESPPSRPRPPSAGRRP